jgi:uncharacterized protein (TIGR00304 family)
MQGELTILMDAGALSGLGIVLIFAGMLIILVAIILFFLSSVREGGKVRGGGVIIIGPFPIIFGTNKEAVKTVLWLAILLIILLIVAMVILYLVFR